MKIDEIRDLSAEDIENNLDEAREELMRMRFQRATGELTNHNLPSYTRKKIARLITALKEKQAEEKSEGEA
jgi:large subunit ribosomal protein L29